MGAELLIVGFDRFLMGFSLFVHIILAVIGVALPLIILIAEYLGIKYNDKDYAVLSRRLMVVFIVLFAVGSASGILVAINLFLLWPTFMALVGQVAILPVYIEVFAFFLESIFIGIYVYSRNKFAGKYSHVLAGIPIAIGAGMSAVMITMLNAFMNTPVGFDIPTYLHNATITGVSPLAVFASPSTGMEVVHVLVTSYFAGSFIFAGYMAYMLFRSNDEDKKRYYRKALAMILAISTIFTFASVITGSLSISSLLTTQPEKFAAIEGNIYPQAFAPERIGGMLVGNTLQYYIPIPNLQSILATGSASGMVPGLASYPRDTWPPLFIHDLFDILVFLGFAIGGFLLLIMLLNLIKKDPLGNGKVQLLLALCGVLALVLVETGWVMAEVGRQPWIIYNVMRVSQAANYSASVLPFTLAILLFYIFIMPFTVIVLKRIFGERPLEAELVNK
ncbi:MAG: cytochrome ubiquinol oxidase subunit I [Candidatus Micrarchaeota archaeon]|nr:cytochrome ubiquinol oxidase subunit I [Candidatus Micrarchaeota archaeon]MDE1848165.1 cytochrome ubiquinol oxidase subunit I [Candidatus Micrarchaeota archaeon]MDE1864647.1 cytochrome ubiquinol oxidase subunit I [Candidatus Micrarchaeota archaeon]